LVRGAGAEFYISRKTTFGVFHTMVSAPLLLCMSRGGEQTEPEAED
jgi:hypothetical protein